MGNDGNINFLFDHWIPGVRLHNQLSAYQMGLENFISEGTWNPPNPPDNCFMSIGRRIGHILVLPVHTLDLIVWKETLDGTYTVSSGHDSLRRHSAKVLWHNLLLGESCMIGSTLKIVGMEYGS